MKNKNVKYFCFVLVFVVIWFCFGVLFVLCENERVWGSSGLVK